MTEKNNLRVLIPSIVIIIFCMAFVGYTLSSVHDSVFNSMNTNNVTANCDIAGYILSKNANQNPYGVSDDLKSTANNAWTKYKCGSLLLEDTFGNSCYGDVGFTYYKVRGDGVGLFYCSNIDKSRIDQNMEINK